MRATISRVSNRAKREVIARFPPATHWVDQRRAAAVATYRPRLRPIDDRRREQVDRLERDGIIVDTWDGLGLPGVEELKPLLLGLVESLAAMPTSAAGDTSTISLSRDQTLQDPRLFQWGVSDDVLDLVEHHFGLPARYYGAHVRREIGDGRVVGVRQWHRDVEDDRNLKILVWLNDVDVAGGPFTYLPRPASHDAARRLRYVGGFIGDDRFAGVVPRSSWQQATGPRWTAVVGDNAQIFHRAQAPVSQDRYSVTFSWTSTTPRKVMSPEPWRSQHTARATAGLTRRQLDALAPAIRGR